jgi:hypothetical protein
VAQHEERRREEHERDDDPAGLLERVVGVEPVDLGQPDRCQEADDRQQVRIGERDGVTDDEVRGDVEPEEDACVRQRRRGDDVLPRDVDGCEPDRSQDPDDDQEGELAIPQAESQRTNLR